MVLAGLMLSRIASAQTPEERAVSALPEYRAESSVSGTIRLWGHGSPKTDFMGKVVRYWEDGFMKFQPGIKFEYRLYGTASAVGALYTGVGDIALMGQVLSPYEIDGFERVLHYPPQSVDIATGSLDVRNMGFAQIFFVHADNPLSRITLAQADAIFGTEHRLGAPGNFRKWGDLGLTGVWADRPIHLYGWAFDNDFWDLMLKEPVFGGSHRWNTDLKGYSHIYNADGTIYDAGLQVLEALNADHDGIAISNVRYMKPQLRVKPLALAARTDGPYYEATKENLISQEYPLTSIVPAVFRHPPGQPIDPKVKEFLRYILSRNGQEDIVRSAGYLPLNPDAVRAQLKSLEEDRPGTEVAASPTEDQAPQASPSVIRVWGSDIPAAIMKLWEDGFQKRHPEVRFDTRLMGTNTAMAGIYSGVADLALMGRTSTPVEDMGFAWILKYKPLGVEVMTGSLDGPGKSPALALLVHRDNPIAQATLAQLDAVFGCERLRGAPKMARTWGDLGLTGEWADKPIHAYAPDVTSGTMVFFRQVVLKDSRKWNWAQLKEFEDLPSADADQQIAAAVANDPYGIGVSNLHFADSRVKPLALAESSDGPAHAATRENLIDRKYPLTRFVSIYLNRAPGKPTDPKLKEFLSYILSPEGQQAVARAGDYLPLSSDVAAVQLRKLD
jgi:phosphate transport system substrate-binding protein